MPDTPRSGITSTRAKARKRALDILFEAELRGTDPLATMAERAADADPPVRDYTRELVTGVVEYRTELDQRIGQALATGWSLERMPRVDRAAVRLGAYEIDHTDVPDPVAVAEAVALVRELSTDESPAFVNGVLGSLIASKTSD